MEIEVRITCCPRCEQNHGRMAFTELAGHHGASAYWVECPITHHPIVAERYSWIREGKQQTGFYLH